MAGRGPAPKPDGQRRTRHTPQRGDWHATPGVGWQHGPIPDVPAGVHADTARAWGVWFRSWFAAHWTPDDLPGLEHVAALHSECRRAFHEPFIEISDDKGRTSYIRRPSPATELRQMLDNYGITPKGQQDRRWQPPKEEQPAPDAAAPASRLYGHLRAVANE